jgi:hypothetical protein
MCDGGRDFHNLPAGDVHFKSGLSSTTHIFLVPGWAGYDYVFSTAYVLGGLAQWVAGIFLEANTTDKKVILYRSDYKLHTYILPCNSL